MPKGLAKKRQVHTGHRASVTKMLHQVEELTAASLGAPVDVAKLTQLKMSLQEKLDILKRLDDEILARAH